MKMPRYKFFCPECNVRFERTLKMGMHPTYPCPQCKDEAPRIWDASTGFGVAFAAEANAGNSGSHTVDHPTADMAVGRSAEQRWQDYHDRAEVKRQAREKGGTHALIRHDGDGYVDYEPMTPVGRQTRKKLYDGAVRALKTDKESKPAKSGE